MTRLVPKNELFIELSSTPTVEVSINTSFNLSKICITKNVINDKKMAEIENLIYILHQTF